MLRDFTSGYALGAGFTGLYYVYNRTMGLPVSFARLAPIDAATPVAGVAVMANLGLNRPTQEGDIIITGLAPGLATMVTTIMGLAISHYCKIPLEVALILSSLLNFTAACIASYNVPPTQASVPVRLQATM